MAASSRIMQHLFARMRSTAPHFRLAAVEGEAGTGKLLLAETLHRIGPAAVGPFAPVLAADFLENARQLWQEARGGLLYLARVDELGAERQRLLRDWLERAAHERMRTHAIGGPLQVVAGSAQILRRLAAAGTFRTDLTSHLTAIRFGLPPLRERREDIPVLAELFLRRWCREHGNAVRGLAPETLSLLLSHAWPGNVLELEMAIAAAALECSGEWIRPVDVPISGEAEVLGQPCSAAAAPDEDPRLDRAIMRHVVGVLAGVNGNKVRAARMLGISRSTLYRLLESGQR